MNDTNDNEESVYRIRKLFIKKLAAENPRHPWVLKEKSMQWQNPRLVDRWWWMDIEQYDNGQLMRYGRVSWDKNGGLYEVSITIQSEHGLGLVCWPSFRILSAAQDFVEKLMIMPPGEIKNVHGVQWPNVIL